MKVLLVGGGGRECALAYKIAQSPRLSRLTVVQNNTFWPAAAEIREAEGVEALVELATDADLVVVGPEAPLEAGLGDALQARSIPCFGPVRDAARLETSKSFCKEILASVGVPTPDYVVVTRNERAKAEKRAARGSVAIKVDGLAAGKGVFVCPTPEEALRCLDQAFSPRFGAAAERVVLEDLLVGPEVSLFALSDGSRVVPLITAQDHKRIGDGDTGPNTGGMGAYAPCPLVDDATADEWVQTLCGPVVEELARRGTPYRGVLYAGLMLTPSGPQVLEFNVRFGDPECQPLMCLWEDDILPWLHGAATGSLPEGTPRFKRASACCVVLASAGYPQTSTRGVPIPEPGEIDDVVVFHAATVRDADGVLRTAGGRVLGVTGIGATLQEARDRAYGAVTQYRFAGAMVRSDIAARGLLAPSTVRD